MIVNIHIELACGRLLLELQKYTYVTVTILYKWWNLSSAEIVSFNNDES